MSTQKGRYAQDPEFREYTKRNNRHAYRKNREPAEQPCLLELETSLYADIEIHNPEDERYGEVVRVPAYSVGDLARVVGKSAGSIRLWTEQGILPPPLFEADHLRGDRIYTFDQVAAVFERVPLLSEVGTNGRENLRFAQELRAVWALMPDGVWPNGQVLVVEPDEHHLLPAERYIYALVDPHDHRVRYVGKAIDPESRLGEHIDVALQKEFRAEVLEPKDEWLLALRAEGLEPLLTILEQTTEAEAFQAELKWILGYREQGAELFNKYPYHEPGEL